MFLRRLSQILLLLPCPLLRLLASPLDEWHLRNPLPIYEHLTCATYANSNYVAFAHSLILNSSDGTNWTAQSLFTPGRFADVLFQNGTFVGVGDGILTSIDGTNWVKRWDLSSDVRSVASGNGQLVAVIRRGVVISSDGTNWTHKVIASDLNLQQVAFGNGIFVARGYHESEPNRIDPAISLAFVSTNGTDWFESTLPDQWGGPIVFGNGIFVTTTGGTSFTSFTSVDGVSWQKGEVIAQSARYDLTLGFGNSKFVAAGGDSTIFTSEDGLNWTQRNGAGERVFLHVLYANGLFVAVGQYGTLFTSRDAVSWTEISSGSLQIQRGAAYGAGTWAVAGGERSLPYVWAGGDNPTTNPASILISDAARRWNATSVDADNLWSIAYGGGLFVAVGQTGSDLVTSTSEDSVSWSFHRFQYSLDRPRVRFLNGEFWIAAGTDFGDAFLANSINGLVWKTNSIAGFGTLNDIAYGNGSYVAASLAYGKPGVLVSTNGLDWTHHPVPFGFATICFGLGRFFGFPHEGQAIATSEDGATWSEIQLPFSTRCHDSIFAADHFVTVGQYIISSEDGLNWTNRLKAGVDFNAVAFGRDTFLAVSQTGIIFESSPLSPSTLPLLTITKTAARLTLTVSCGSFPSNTSFVLQRSANLVNWTDLINIGTGSANIALDVASAGGTEFYRLRY